jgi:chaperonin GroEL (HSP60 family)
MVVDAMQSVKVTNLYGDSKYPVKSVNIVKSHGGKSSDSLLIKVLSFLMFRDMFYKCKEHLNKCLLESKMLKLHV